MRVLLNGERCSRSILLARKLFLIVVLRRSLATQTVLECLLRLLEQGYATQITLAHDICTRLQFRHYGGWGWDHLLTNIVPRLRHAGVSQQELDAMFIVTPRRLLTLVE